MESVLVTNGIENVKVMDALKGALHAVRAARPVLNRIVGSQTGRH
jgi:hypothetical protein